MTIKFFFVIHALEKVKYIKMNNFKVQEHIDTLQRQFDCQKEEMERLKQEIADSQLTIKKIKEEEKKLEKLRQELKELERVVECSQAMIDEAKETATMFQMFRSDPHYQGISLTPQEFNMEKKFQEFDNKLKTLAEMKSTMTALEQTLCEMGPAEAVQEDIFEVEEKIQHLNSNQEKLKKKIKKFQRIQRCFQAQQELEQALPGFIQYIYNNWDEDAEDFILTYLQTEGESRNVPFQKAEIQRLIEFIDQVFYADGELEETSLEAEMTIMSLAEFQKKILDMKVKPELVVAFANTIHLLRFPENFFRGKHGKIGTKDGLSPETVILEGVLPWDARDALLTCGRQIPTDLENLLEQEYAHKSRVFYSFRKDVGHQSKGQLYDLRHFLQEFWRFGNFYGFTYSSQLHVHLEKQDTSIVVDHYKSYRQTRQQQGLFLTV